MTHFKLSGSIIVLSQEWLKLELSNFEHRETITSPSKVMTNQPKKGRGSAHVTHFCKRYCGIRKISPRHAVNWEQQFRWW